MVVLLQPDKLPGWPVWLHFADAWVSTANMHHKATAWSLLFPRAWNWRASLQFSVCTSAWVKDLVHLLKRQKSPYFGKTKKMEWFSRCLIFQGFPGQWKKERIRHLNMHYKRACNSLKHLLRNPPGLCFNHFWYLSNLFC